MRILLVSHATPGLLTPTLELGAALRAAGHQPVLLSEPSALDEADGAARVLAAGVDYLPPQPDRPAGLRIEQWGQLPAVAAQCVYLQHALRRVRPQLVVGHLFNLACHAVCARVGLPLSVLAGACWPFPLPDASPVDACSGATWDNLAPEMAWRERQFLNVLNEARLMLQLDTLAGDDPGAALMGDLCLLRSSPLLERRAPLPERVRFVGSLLPDEGSADPRSAAWLERAGQDAPVLYVQQGRTFGHAGFVRAVLDSALALGCRVLLDPLRADVPLPAPPDHAHVLSRPPSPAMLRRCAAVVSSGHPSSVLAAASAGLPMLLFPSGSGSDDLVARCVLAGAALSMAAPSPRDQGTLRDVLGSLLVEPRFRQAAEELGSSLAPYRGGAAAVEAIEALALRYRRDVTSARGAHAPAPAGA